MIIFAVVMVYIAVLAIRRIVKGYYSTWIKKWYFYLEIHSEHHYWVKVRCKRLNYLLNPFAQTITLIIEPFERLADEKIFVKLYRSSSLLRSDVFDIKNIKGGNPDEIFFTFKDFFTSKKDLSTSKNTYYKVPFSHHHHFFISPDRPIVFRDIGVLKMYPYKAWSNKELRAYRKML